MNGQPTEAQEKFFDSTVAMLEMVAATATAAATALGEGDFDHAVFQMKFGAGISDDEVWETLTRSVTKLRDISDEIESEGAA